MSGKKRKHKNILWMACLLTLSAAAGCQTYQEQAFDPNTFLAEVVKERHYVPDTHVKTDTFTFETAARWMSENSPQIKLLKKEYDIFRAVAETPVPFPNPSVEGGPSLNFYSPMSPLQKVVPYVSIGFVIPLGPRLSREDDLNQAKAMQAYQKILVGHRNLYLTLREDYIRCAIMERRRYLAMQIADMAVQAEKVSRKLESAGYITAIDVYEAVVERGRQEVANWDQEQSMVQSISAISNLIGGRHGEIMNRQFEQLPTLPGKIPTVDSLQKIMIENNPDLAALQTQRLVTDAQYKLELAKQIPDLVIGSNYGTEFDKTQTIGFTAGMEVPVFNRNQVAIAEAKHTRDYTAQEYKSMLTQKMNALEQLVCRYEMVAKKIRLLRKDLMPNAEKTLNLAEKGTSSGVITALQCIRIQRDYRDILRDHLVLYQDLWDIQLQIERTIGYPLALFESESKSLIPSVDLKNWDELLKEADAIKEAAEKNVETADNNSDTNDNQTEGA